MTKEEFTARNKQVMQMPMVRIFYQKVGRAKYISHLDVTRGMQRAFKRAGLPVWYTQGFHPHMYMTFALPLSLGQESLCEAVEVRMEEHLPAQEIQSRLQAALPEGFVVTEVIEPIHKAQDIVQARYELSWYSEDLEGLAKAFRDFCGQAEIPVQKRTKKGDKRVDIRPDFVLEECVALKERVVTTLLCAAGQHNLNPQLLVDAFLTTWQEAPKPLVRILRTQVLVEGQEKFR